MWAAVIILGELGSLQRGFDTYIEYNSPPGGVALFVTEEFATDVLAVVPEEDNPAVARVLNAGISLRISSTLSLTLSRIFYTECRYTLASIGTHQ